MTDTSAKLSQLVRVVSGFKPSVQLPSDFENDEINRVLIRTYIPTSQSIAFLAEVARSINTNSTERARLLVGTYGTGKSDLLLMLCNYFFRNIDDPIMQPFYEKLKEIDSTQYYTITQNRSNKPPFLVVLLQADAMKRFRGFILYGLQQALEKVGLSHLMRPTQYRAAYQKIVDWQKENHPILRTFIELLRSSEKRELDSLLAELQSSEADMAFPVFQRVFRSATGTEFDIYSFDEPHEIYINIAQELKKSGSYSGILVVCDEFTEFLRRFQEAIDQQSIEIDSETLAIQNLAERSSTSNQAQIHFIIASLEGFSSSAVNSSSGASSKVIERIGGRFKQFSLQSQGSEELIRGAIQRVPGSDGYQRLPNHQRDELLDIANKIWRSQGKTRAWMQDTIIDGTFPLHPLTLFALPVLNQLVAQSQRTMYLFLIDEDGLEGYLTKTPLVSQYANWHNLLTIDLLYDYFADSIAARRSEITDAYNHSLQIVSMATIDTTLAKRVLKALAICEVISSPFLAPTRSFLRQALNLPSSEEGSLAQALEILEQRDAIILPIDDDGAYSLPVTGRANSTSLRRRITDKARELHTNIATLQVSRPPEPLKADTYNRKYGTHRVVSAYYVGVKDLENASRLKNDLAQNRDGLLWYVIISSESERSEALSYARALVAANPRLIIAVPVRPLPLLNAFRNYEALEAIRSDPSLNEAERKLLADNGQLGKGYASALQVSLEALKSAKQWEWLYGTNTITQIMPAELASRMMGSVFSATPEHQLAQHFKADAISPSLKKAVSELLKGEVRLTKGKAAADESILRNGAVSLGLLSKERDEGAFEVFSINEPRGHSNSLRVWQLMYERLSSQKTWQGVVSTLREAPYGMYDSLLLIFTAAFVVYYADEIEVRKNGPGLQRTLNLDFEVLKNMLEKPQEYSVRLHQLTDFERQWLRRIVTHGLNKQSFDSSGGRGTTLRDRVAEQVKNWQKRLPLPMFAERLTPEQILEFAPNSKPNVLEVVRILLQAGLVEVDLGTVLLRDVPKILDAPTKTTTWTQSTVDDLVDAFIEARSIITTLPEQLSKHAIGRVAAVFGQEASDNPWQGIYQWQRDRKVVDPQSVKVNARALLRLTSDTRGSISSSLLEEFAKQMVGVNATYLQWSMYDQLEKFLQRLQEAKQEVDEAWKLRAPVEDIWHDGIIRFVLGRPVTGATTEQVAQELENWSKGVEWPACAHKISLYELQLLYPQLSEEECRDITSILNRIGYQKEDWQNELIEKFAALFGVKTWSSSEVELGLKRVGKAVTHSQMINDALRNHILKSMSDIFIYLAGTSPSNGINGYGDPIKQWRQENNIPVVNDLSHNAQILLEQIDSSVATDTLLLTALPRALDDIGLTYKQWPSFQILVDYINIVSFAVNEINNYIPLTSSEYAWLSGIVKVGIRQQFTSSAQEQRKLARYVAKSLREWMNNLKLPIFSEKLTLNHFRDLFPQSNENRTQSMYLLLTDKQTLQDEPVRFLLSTLPLTLGLHITPDQWTEQDVDELLDVFKDVCRDIEDLNQLLKQHLYTDIGSIFGVETGGYTSRELLSGIHAWRKQRVIFPNEALSETATIVYEALQSIDDPDMIFLERLPRKLAEVRTPYMQWPTWDKHEQFISMLKTAAQEITEVGQVAEATPVARNLWAEFRERIDELSLDDRRWLIQTFNDTFQI
jgi:hypothetical protein